MNEIELSVMPHGVNSLHELPELLKPFEERHHAHVQIRWLNWETAWAELLKVALYGDGPDVSEVGSTWVGNLAGMNALRPFAPADVQALGGAEAFAASAWKGGLVGEKSTSPWAIPWLADTRMIYYRRDWLARAGVEESTAFKSAQAITNTLEQLKVAGMPGAWSVPTGPTLNTMHNVVSWVWEAGGDFVSADGRTVMFNKPEARAGLKAYFSLRRYLHTTKQLTPAGGSHALFRRGEVGAIISGPWTLQYLHVRDAKPEVIDNLGGAALPGQAFVGGSHFVLWKHTRRTTLALELIKYLTSSPAQHQFTERTGDLLPARLDAIADSPMAVMPAYAVLSNEVRMGRPYPSIARWGLVEERLAVALSDIWQAALADLDSDLDAILDKKLNALAQRLQHVLQQ